MARARAGLGSSSFGCREGRVRGPAGGRLPALAALLLCAACGKVPLTDINAGFTLADAAWFSQEQTLFVFWRLQAEQGIGPESEIEISWVTDQAEQPWTAVSQLTPVHTHLPVDCGVGGRCGSTSLFVPIEPRQVRVRLRYHRDGQMFLDAPLSLHLVGPGPAHTNRSLIVYGVFDETNTRVQWRARHQFPALRNQEAEELGLRRSVRVADPGYGEAWLPADNPYGYGFDDGCPASQVALGWPELATSDRAVFEPQALPRTASTSPLVCARSTVTDATGSFEAVAVARKNPETRAAFPSLRSPIRENTAVGFLLRPCSRTISSEHEQVQEQRLLLDGPVEICLDDWLDPDFQDSLAARMRAEVDARRALGRDMVITVALHHDDESGRLAPMVESALEELLAPERDKSSPRVSGAFVYDSYGYTITRPQLAPLALWCPAKTLPDDLEQVPSNSATSCPLVPDMPDLKLGPFRFNQLPILPTRRQYLNFVEKYSDGQAGRMRELRFLAPERTPLSDNVAVPPYGVATFFNNEVLSAQPGDSFSFCASEDQRSSLVVFRSALGPDPMPLSALPQSHALFPQTSYALGLFWDFPFLLRLKYETSLAGAATAYSFTVPFGISDTAQAYYGTQIWEQEEFALSEVLTQCTRFCDHPTFDSAGVYNVLTAFSPGYAEQCYRPRYPLPTDGGFPLDP